MVRSRLRVRIIPSSKPDFINRSVVYVSLVHVKSGVEDQTSSHWCGKQHPVRYGLQADVERRFGDRGARLVDFGMKRQNSFDVSNPAGSGRIEIGAGLQSLITFRRLLFEDSSFENLNLWKTPHHLVSRRVYRNSPRCNADFFLNTNGTELEFFYIS
ncbi:hypothetical protein AVEN_269661-1 [Araneus ventricosus]|uniref:Uncharacterized protein n=1 Tax=Araneus ventricosus TaxID=182803 RepID=A0A4Y2TVB4_ARAVE|nr:hypothetical protein AVEN_269661-1 [Araneus ventricosus]